MRKNPYAYKTEHITKEELILSYNNLQSLNKVAKLYGVHSATISGLMKKFNIPYLPKLTRTKKEDIFSEENETSFYLAGFIAADGTILHRQRNYHLAIYLGNKDIDHLKKIQNLLQSDSKIIKRINKSVINGKEVNSIINGFTVCSKQIYNDLTNNFCISENKSLSLNFPEHLINNPLINHFIRGYFDGDGSFSIRNPNIKNKQKNINMCFELLGTKQFLSKVQEVLVQNISLKENEIEIKDNIFRLRYSGNNNSKLIGDWLYKDASIFLDRKYNRYTSINLF